jgi:hypothetical protein
LELADYYFIYQYLRQQGVIDISESAEGTPQRQGKFGMPGYSLSACSFDPEPDVVAMVFFMITQIALNVCELIPVTGIRLGKYDKASPEYLKALLIYYKELADSAVHAFVRLVKEFHTVGEIAGNVLLRGRSWNEAADLVCERFDLPRYTQSIQTGLRRMDRSASI